MTQRVHVTWLEFRRLPSFLSFGGPYSGANHPCPGGRVVVESGSRQQQASFGPLTDPGRVELSLELVFDGDATIAVYETGVEGSVLWVTIPMMQPETPIEATRNASTSDGLATYTVGFRIEGRAPDHGVRPGAAIDQCLVSPDGWNCVAPTETALVFAPVHNRRRLVDANGDAVTSAALRQGYRTRVHEYATANPGVRHPWLGERDDDGERIGLVVSGQRLHIKDSSDATGAFHIGLAEFSRYWRVPAENQFFVDNGFDADLALGHGHTGQGDAFDYDQRRAGLLAPMNAYRERLRDGDVDAAGAIAIFCHGWREGFQLGFTGLSAGNAGTHVGLRELVTAIKAVSRQDVVVVLYACATAHLPNDGRNFAALLRDALISGSDPKPHCRVVGHLEVAHSFMTPDVMVFEGTDGAGASGTEVVPTGTPEFARFRAILNGSTPHTGLRWAFPFMSVESVRAFCAIAEPDEDAYALP
jgi:hypothetical protein